MIRYIAVVFTVTVSLVVPSAFFAAEFGHPGGPDIENIHEISRILRADRYDLEVLLSFGNSKGGSGGHLALALRDQAPCGTDDLVFSGNRFSDRAEKHAEGFYTENLMAMIPKNEYLFKTTSTLSPYALFGLDMGEIFKRSVIGVRVFGVPQEEIDGLTAFLHRLNADYQADLPRTDYYPRRIVYGYTTLNCALAVALAFKHGAGYDDLPIKGSGLLGRLNPITPLTASVPTAVTMDVIEQLAQRGYDMDVVLYRKYPNSTYIDPTDSSGTMFKDIPNRFPSVFSLDFRSEAGQYEDYRNLYAKYLLHYMGRYSVAVDPATRLLTIEASRDPLPYDQASVKADAAARRDSKSRLRRIFRTWGVRFGSATDNTHLIDFSDVDD